jgi:site-specific DNA-methyltransferase (adenine-specific)
VKPYYESQGITLYHSNCDEVLPALPDASVDLVITSPPYNLANSSGGCFRGTNVQNSKWRKPVLADGYDDFRDDMPWERYTDWQRSVVAECWRLISDTGAIFYNHKPRVQNGVVRLPTEYVGDLPIRQIVIWARAGGVNFSPTFYCPTHEWVIVVAKPDFRLKSKGASGVGDVWQIAQESGSDHPAPFPIALPLRIIETTAPRVVLDPFCGSGTTLRAAKDSGVSAIGIERNERYCEIAANRLSQEVLMFA